MAVARLILPSQDGGILVSNYEGDPMQDTWVHWRAGVVAELRRDLQGVLEVDEDDVDWDAWRPLFEEGRSPRAAVDRAFVRDV